MTNCHCQHLLFVHLLSIPNAEIHHPIRWPTSERFGTPWPVFLDSVLPYAVLDEPRDIRWGARRRFHQILSVWPPPLPSSSPSPPPPPSSSSSATAGGGSARGENNTRGQSDIVDRGRRLLDAPNATAAMHLLAAAIPFMELEGSQGYGFESTPVPVPGNAIKWRSETAPAMLSTKQVVEFNGGSCTGTAVILVVRSSATLTAHHREHLWGLDSNTTVCRKCTRTCGRGTFLKVYLR